MPEEKKTPLSPADAVRDIVKALGLGFASAGALAAVPFAAGALLGGGSLAAGLEAAKSGLFLGAALALFLLAGMLMLKGKKPENDLRESGWQRHFRLLSPKWVLALFAVAWILLAAGADALLLWLNRG